MNKQTVLYKMKRAKDEKRTIYIFLYIHCRTKEIDKKILILSQPNPWLLSRSLAEQEQVNRENKWNMDKLIRSLMRKMIDRMGEPTKNPLSGFMLEKY